VERWLGAGIGAIALLVGLWNTVTLIGVKAEVEARSALTAASSGADAGEGPERRVPPRMTRSRPGGPPAAARPGRPGGAKPSRPGGPRGAGGEPVADRMETQAAAFAEAEGLDAETTRKLLDAVEQRVASIALLREDVKANKVDRDGAKAEIEALREQSDATLTAILGADGFARFEESLERSGPRSRRDGAQTEEP
jgi:hypothetical protein